MKTFIKNTISITTLYITLIVILLVLSSLYTKSKGFTNYTTESNTLWLKENTEYDILFMGISHARNFSRYKNHLRIEKILGSKIGNIAQGKNICGVNEQLFYLDYFYYKGNKASKILYILTPPMLFSETLPIASNTFKYEAFEFPFLLRYFHFDSENKGARIISYLQWSLHPRSIFNKPNTIERMESKLDTLNLEIVRKGQNLAYSGTNLNFNRFNNSIKIIEKTIMLAERNNSDVILVIPPALFGKWRGHKETIDFANSMKEKYSTVKVFDGSETVLTPDLYYDNHHLNTEGIVYFTEEYLNPIVK